MKTLLIVIIALAIIAGGIYAYRLGTAPSNSYASANACTTEARLCPNGSYVGRTGPNCEFAQCPTSTINGNIIVGTSTATSTNGNTHSTTTSTTTRTLKVVY